MKDLKLFGKWSEENETQWIFVIKEIKCFEWSLGIGNRDSG